MPEISLFYGIKISMNWSEHNPPHFHAEYADYKASVLIEDDIISAGGFDSLRVFSIFCI